MNAPGLTKTRILIAIFCGILVAFVYIYATVPHLVESPVQVITPVPTPPPVVITNQPVAYIPQSYDVSYLTDNIVWLSFIMLIIPIIIFIMMALSDNDGEYGRRKTSGSSLISIIIGIILLGVSLWILSVILDSMAVVMAGLP